MTHPSHMPKDEMEAYEAGDVEALKAICKAKAEFCLSIADGQSVPYDHSQRYATPGAFLEAQRREESAIFDGVITLLDVWEDYRAGRVTISLDPSE